MCYVVEHVRRSMPAFEQVGRCKSARPEERGEVLQPSISLPDAFAEGARIEARARRGLSAAGDFRK